MSCYKLGRYKESIIYFQKLKESSRYYYDAVFNILVATIKLTPHEHETICNLFKDIKSERIYKSDVNGYKNRFEALKAELQTKKINCTPLIFFRKPPFWSV